VKSVRGDDNPVDDRYSVRRPKLESNTEDCAVTAPEDIVQASVPFVIGLEGEFTDEVHCVVSAPSVESEAKS
jgi:hypothetical protein